MRKVMIKNKSPAAETLNQIHYRIVTLCDYTDLLFHLFQCILLLNMTLFDYGLSSRFGGYSPSCLCLTNLFSRLV